MTHIDQLFRPNAVIFHEKMGIVIFYFTGTLIFQQHLHRKSDVVIHVSVHICILFSKRISHRTWNFRRATKYCILLMTLMADLCAWESLKRTKQTNTRVRTAKTACSKRVCVCVRGSATHTETLQMNSKSAFWGFWLKFSVISTVENGPAKVYTQKYMQQ